MRNLSFIVVILILLSACTGDHFISEPGYLKKVEKQFAKQKELAKNRSEQLFGVFDQDLTTRETEALKFLLAYSSLNDLADYSGDFFLQNIRSSFAARDTFPWGKTVPEDVFRHFVLPVRVNNENLDSSRWVFFSELKDRIKHLPMKEAALEVNHWCHEKVTYRGSDARTSSPLATVKTAWGRCGEESTFTVAAMRSVGIPARQCYTPRWAHSDDNHAWVEVWIDGRWRYLGACEPDADLDLAWFTKPAKRAMLVNTTVFGDYGGPEDVLQKDELFTKINVLENYAPVKTVFARVNGKDGRNIDSATVEFQLYNYAEFYPLFKTATGADGLCSFKTGYGDLLVWAAKDGRYGFRKLDARETDTLTIKLDHEAGETFTLDLDLVPPAEIEDTVVISDSAKKQNSERLAFEDGIRQSYEATFMDSLKSLRLAKLLNLNPDTLWYFLHKSYGNWREITNFVTQSPESMRSLIFPLLGNISDKDLRDADTSVLMDNLLNSFSYSALTSNPEMIRKYILSPRIDNEFLKPYKHYFQHRFDSVFINKARRDPEQISSWVRDNITHNQNANYSRAAITPAGVYEIRVADMRSAHIFFVALCRSFGIPARLEPATKVPQYLLNEDWHDVWLFEDRPGEGKKGSVELSVMPAGGKRPEYTIHFTLQEFKDGFFRTLDYEGSPLVQSFPCKVDIPEGTCLLVTGNRLTDGTVLARLKIFQVAAGEPVNQEVELRNNPMPLIVFGKIDLSLTGKTSPEGTIIAWIDPDKEPTKHLLAELRQKKGEFNAWDGSFKIVLPDKKQKDLFLRTESLRLPAKINYSLQTEFPFRYDSLPITTGSLRHLPVVIFVNRTGEIIYCSEGYRIGTANELLHMIR